MSNFAFLDLQAAVTQPPPPLDFVLPGLKQGTVGAVVSPGATGKTMLMLQAAIAVAGGADLLGLRDFDDAWQMLSGKVVFLTGEDPPDVLAHRVHAIGQHLGAAQRQAVFKNLQIAPLVGLGPDLMRPDWRNWAASVASGARLVIIDTLRRFHQLDENDGGAMAALLAVLESFCREQNTTVLFLHHTSKSGALTAGDAQQASRGSSVLTDNARFQANLCSMSTEDAKKFDVDDSCRKSFVRLSFPKINYSAPIQDKWFRRRAGGVLEPAVLSTGAGLAWIKKKTIKTGADDDF